MSEIISGVSALTSSRTENIGLILSEEKSLFSLIFMTIPCIFLLPKGTVTRLPSRTPSSMKEYSKILSTSLLVMSTITSANILNWANYPETILSLFLKVNIKIKAQFSVLPLLYYKNNILSTIEINLINAVQRIKTQ